MGFRLSLLDQSPIADGKSAYQALQQTIALAEKAEEWGYHRFWVSEHHDTKLLAGVSPEVLVSHLLARTSRIRIGSGGVMLQHYSAYKVAENFNLLATLAPKRVDLGVGKAPGGLPLSTKALQFGRSEKTDFEEQLVLLKQFVDGELPVNHVLAGVGVDPEPPTKPDIFLLGASVASAELASTHGVNYCFAKFINSDERVLQEAVTAYRRKSPNGELIIAVPVLAADTEEEAQALAGEQKVVRVTLSTGVSVTLQTVAQAEEFARQAGVTDFKVEERVADIIVGTAQQVKAELVRLRATFDVDEFVIHTPIARQDVRLRSVQLISEAILTANV
ncbi:LLM class flavin-dependent oxidoreductase [Paenilisteria rocourtiae]|uniref:Luciferase family oxidoreductase group 1 n=1 Tax=Listeria rocourtiae TaxID=647910 RepID=A0A4R6ZHU5_9LIST|nr:LLM class flavin-dependent oxidoreductase [Listeria rocourtiae]EUJ42619.1 luciferase family oxidoreductase [Listeria rocourtiae FSL F6-920]MBC1605303.1 LLM class flavin-dependent oxidoreductase [Listeria rocourtiae]TDR51798.1 luciferase family oxidoreductase group 1 [Listeria rocourtiae]